MNKISLSDHYKEAIQNTLDEYIVAIIQEIREKERFTKYPYRVNIDSVEAHIRTLIANNLNCLIDSEEKAKQVYELLVRKIEIFVAGSGVSLQARIQEQIIQEQIDKRIKRK